MEDEHEYGFHVGMLVLAKIGQHPHWPGRISKCDVPTTDENYQFVDRWRKLAPEELWVSFIDTDEGAWVPISDIKVFTSRTARVKGANRSNEKLRKAVQIALQMQSGDDTVDVIPQGTVDSTAHTSDTDAEGDLVGATSATANVSNDSTSKRSRVAKKSPSPPNVPMRHSRRKTSGNKRSRNLNGGGDVRRKRVKTENLSPYAHDSDVEKSMEELLLEVLKLRKKVAGAVALLQDD